MLDLNDFQVFAQVVNHRGFTAAARALGRPKSTLSKRVAELEKRLGVRLIQRSSRRFAVTAIGREVHRHAAAMLIEAEAAESAVQGRLAEPSGTVRITASLPTAQHLLAPILPELACIWPKVQIELHATDRFVDVVQEGFDIALRAHFAPLPDSALIQRRIGFDPVILVAAPQHLEESGIPDGPAAITSRAGLLTSHAATIWTLSSDGGEMVEVSPQPRFCADEATALIEAAVAGLGIACLPRRLCERHLAEGSLVRVLPGWTAGGVTTTMLMPHRRGQLPSVRAVADALVDRLAS